MRRRAYNIDVRGSGKTRSGSATTVQAYRLTSWRWPSCGMPQQGGKLSISTASSASVSRRGAGSVAACSTWNAGVGSHHSRPGGELIESGSGPLLQA